MCQRFLIIAVFFMGIAFGVGPEFPAPREGLFVPGPNGIRVIQVANDGQYFGWIDISNKTLISAAGNTGRSITLVNYEKPNRPSYTLGASINMSTRKFLFRANPPKHIACYYSGGKQVNCDEVVNIIYYYPYHNAFNSERYNDLGLA
jgi:hypothetical protein